MSHPLFKQVQERLAKLDPKEIRLVDTSTAHVGHAGNQVGNAHLELHISSAQFEGLTTLACHRLIYQLLNDLIPHPIHALSIKIIR